MDHDEYYQIFMITLYIYMALKMPPAKMPMPRAWIRKCLILPRLLARNLPSPPGGALLAGQLRLASESHRKLPVAARAAAAVAVATPEVAATTAAVCCLLRRPGSLLRLQPAARVTAAAIRVTREA
jgi:hypothetical protein